jgi:ketosteroid isomerase-like protein
MLPFALLFFLVAQPATQPQNLAAALPDDRFVRDLHDKNIDDVLTLYTPDAVFVNPDGTQATGPGLRKLYEQVTAAFDSDLHLHDARIKRHGDTTVEDGTYTETLGHRDTGKVDNVHGTYRFTFRREADGRWLYTPMEWH